MAILKLIGFAGENPKVVARLLPDNAAQNAFNTRLDDGGLTPVRQKKFVTQLSTPPVGGYKTIYKHGSDWLAWGDVVYAAPGPVATDRLYIMGDGVPKMKVGATTYNLAVAAPTGALTAALGGTPTSDIGSTRIYVYTWVTDFGEESEPCPASNEVYWKPGNTVTLSGFASTPAGRNITKQRIYRSQTSITGTLLYLIAERTASTSNYVDSIPVDAFQEALPSADWTPPTDTMTGLISLPNGMMAAFDGKDVCFCEPYRPHAWPDKYKLAVDYDIVGLGAYGTTIVVTTEGHPYVVTGSAPESMVMEKLELNLPCINARGIIDLGYAVAYPSHDGLVLASQGGARIATEAVFSRDDWLHLNPHGMNAGQYDGRYFTAYNYSDSGSEYRGTLILDMTGEQPFVIRTDVEPDAMFYDLPSGNLYMLVTDSIYEWDSLSEPFAMQSWKSKLFVLPRPTNFGAILIEADDGLTPAEIAAIEAQIAAILAENATIFALSTIGGELNGAALNEYTVNGDMMLPVPTLNRTLTVNVYADRSLVATVGTSNSMARLPSGFLSRLWEVEVTSDMPLTQITMATTGAELMQV